MNKIGEVVLVVFLFLTSGSFAVQAPEQPSESLVGFYDENFKKYPSLKVELSTKALLQWRSDKKARKYKTSLLSSWNAAKSPNFAGHYFAASGIGCGTGCAVIFIIDWNTGKIFYPKEDHAFLTKKESRLLVLKPYDECTAFGPPILLEFRDGLFHEIQHSKCQTAFPSAK